MPPDKEFEQLLLNANNFSNLYQPMPTLGLDWYLPKPNSEPLQEISNIKDFDTFDYTKLFNDLNVLSLGVKAADTLNDVAYSSETPLGNTPLQDEALRGTAEDRHVLNRAWDFLRSGNGLWGRTTADKRLDTALEEQNDFGRSMSNYTDNVRNNNVIENTLYGINNNPLLQPVQGSRTDRQQVKAAAALNRNAGNILNNIYSNAYSNIAKNDARQLRTNMYNVFQQGGYIPNDNNITEFNTGDTHQNNPYGGILQGIASDGKPNYVEEGEVRWNDYIFSARNKPSKSLVKKYLLPKKYEDKTFAEIAEGLQKESKNRPNDPISNNTLDEMLGRLAGAQEEYNYKKEQRQLARAFDKLSNEDKLGLMQLAMQQPTQEDMYTQEEQPMDYGLEQYANGGGIHIKPSKRGTFTAAATKHGKSVQAFASQVLAHPENYSPAMVKKANFARNFGGHKHAEGGYLVGQTYDVSEKEYNRLISLGYEIERI